ncbi:MAG: class B sortase [Peptoniphilaceae bacterium]|uniref:class B sortase n=1 Tax=Parvimonas sp. TaxID=1944660 RepID=UPI0025FA20BB|nr:class B sortase [Parvimonas sp.]MCI5997090.1 class B sortase [Parvimonas sp.]MDD7765380.1 class B sortase [Peptoniphilaceae bacterium]MDY3051273.1 class B sortase [Parvimonas sp.]
MENKNLIVKKKKKKTSGVKKWFWNILFIVCLGLFLYSSFNIVKDYYGSYKAGNNLKNLRKAVFKNEDSTSEKTTDVKKVIDLEELKKLNSDSIGWIEIPGTTLDEPLVQGKDNDYYLWRSFEKKTYPVTGAIFLDMYSKPDLSDRISYIFGHNVWDKSKFYCLEYFEDPSFLEKHKELFIHTENGKLEYEILGVDLVDPNTPLYELSSNRNNDLEAMKKELKKHISASEVDKINENTKLLMLVTCKNANDNSSRRILFAKLKNS